MLNDCMNLKPSVERPEELFWAELKTDWSWAWSSLAPVLTVVPPLFTAVPPLLTVEPPLFVLALG